MKRKVNHLGMFLLTCVVCCGCIAPPAGLTVRPEGLALQKPGKKYAIVGRDEFSEDHPLECFGWLPFPSSLPRRMSKRIGAEAREDLYVGDIEVYSDLYLCILPYVVGIPWYFIHPQYHVEYTTFREVTD